MYLKYLLSSHSYCELQGAVQTDHITLVLFVQIQRVYFITDADLMETKWVALQCCSVTKRGEYLTSPFALLYFQCKVKLLCIIHQYLFCLLSKTGDL